MSVSSSVATVTPVRSVQGRLQVPGDKSIAHRYALIAALSDGTSRLTNYAPGADCHSTLRCLAALGVGIDESPRTGVVTVATEEETDIPASYASQPLAGQIPEQPVAPP